MRRLSTERPFTCVTCEAEIEGTAVFHVGLPFCCAGCVAGGPCKCSYDVEAIEAILGSGPGDMVEVIAPVGRRIVSVLAVE
jgi:hypothetical protein